MPTTDTNVPQVIVNKLTKAQYETATKSPTEFYAVSDEQIGTSDIADGAVTAAKASFTTYSTSEQVVGTWTDGKPIYRKVIDLGALPNATYKNVAHGIINLGTVVKANAVATTGRYSLPIPFVDLSNPTTQSISYSIDRNGNITITTGSDRTSWTGFIILEYTKTTD